MFLIITNVFELEDSITFVNTLSERLKYARKLRDLTQKQLAQAAKISQGAISNYETRLRSSPRHLLKLAAALKVSPLWLAEGVGPIETQPLALLTLQDNSLANQTATTWPFDRISAADVLSLSAEQRRMIEDVILTWTRNNSAS